MTEKLTNIFSNEMNVDISGNLNKILSDLSIGDTKHDFGYQKKILESELFTNAYNYGLPESFDNVYNEADNLNSIIKSFKVDGDTAWTETSSKQYSPVQLFNPESKHLENYIGHSIQTKNGKIFEVKYTDVKPPSNNIIGSLIGGKTIDAQTFYNKLGLNDYNNIAIIVDAASIALYDILSKGPEVPGKNIFYIFGPEVVNDPATKKLPQDKIFINNQKKASTQNKGVIFHSCFPVSLIKSYNYKYDLSKGIESTSYLDSFYSNYNFDLSEIKTNINGKSVSYITNLDIKGKENEFNPVVNSGEKNKITFIEKIVSNFLSLIKTSKEKNKQTSNKINNEEKFLFSSRLQQKRSGDWLQVLLCSSVKDKLRSFQEYNSDGNNIVNILDNVFLVTHDQIALSFALLNGINCIFTHHNSKHHFHSAMTFISSNPQDMESQQKEHAKKCRENSSFLQNEIQNLKNNIKEYTNTTYQNTTNKLKIDLQESIKKTMNDIDNKFSNIINKKSKYVMPVFENNTRLFFTQSLKLIFSKSIYPDLQDQNLELNKLTEMLVNLNDENDLVVINNYNIIQSSINNIKSILNNINSITTDEYLTQIEKFTNSNIYKTANNWRWDVNLTSRELSLYFDQSNNPIYGAMVSSNKSNTTIYGADRNIFLYNLNNLDDDIKQQLAYIYYKEYQGLKLFDNLQGSLDYFMNSGKITIRSYNKFRAISLTFCVEVLLTISGDAGVIGDSSKDNPSNLDITTLMDNFLVTMPNRYNLIKDALVIQEDNNYNLLLNSDVTNTESESVSNNPEENITNQQPLSLQEKRTKESQQYICDSVFETSTKQVTKPLMTLILFGPYPQKLYDSEKNITTTTQPDAQQETLPETQEIADETSNKKQRTIGGAITDNMDDIFNDSKLCFHPLLPVYILTQSFLSSINNEDIESSLDCDLFVNYFNFLKIIKGLVINIYSGENNNNEKKIQAYKIGVGLKQLFFVENNNIESYQECIEVLNTNDEIFSKVSSYTETLVNNFCGKITYDNQETQNSSIYLKSNLFKEFIRNIDINKIFLEVPDYTSFDQNIFRRLVLKFSSEVAKQIITDRGMEYNDPTTSIKSPDVVASGVKRKQREERTEVEPKHHMDVETDHPMDVETEYVNKNMQRSDMKTLVPVGGDKNIKLTRRYKKIVKNKTRRHVKKNNKSRKKIKKNKKTRRNKKKRN